MATILAGYLGELVYVADASDAQDDDLVSAFIFRWVLELNRKLIPVTELNKAMPSFLPSHGGGTVTFESYITDASAGPGAFNTVPARMSLRPHGGFVGNQIILGGWLETLRWESGIGAPNILVARLIITEYGAGTAAGVFGGAANDADNPFHGEPELTWS